MMFDTLMLIGILMACGAAAGLGAYRLTIKILARRHVARCKKVVAEYDRQQRWRDSLDLYGGHDEPTGYIESGYIEPEPDKEEEDE